MCRAGGDGGLGELLKLEPIKEASHSPPSIKNTTKPTTSTTADSPPSHIQSTIQKKSDIAVGVKETFKSPTGILAGDLGRNLSIKSPPIQTPKLMALPKHMQAAQLGSKVVRCKGSSLLTSTAMRFQSGNDGLNSILDGSPDPIPGKYVYRNIVCILVIVRTL